MADAADPSGEPPRPGLSVVVRDWGRIGCIGFGGPPASSDCWPTRASGASWRAPARAAIGAIIGAAIPLALALTESWQLAVLGAAAIALFVLRRGIVSTLVAAGAIGALAATLGAPLTS